MANLDSINQQRRRVGAKNGFFYSAAGFLFIALSVAIPLSTLQAASPELSENDGASLDKIVGAEEAAQVPPYLQPRQDPAPQEELEKFRLVTFFARRGDSLARLLIRFGVKDRERAQWLRSVQKSGTLRALRPGQEIHFYFTRGESSAPGSKAKGSLKALEIEISEERILTWEKGSKGIVFSKRDKPYDVELKTAAGVVEGSFAEDALKAGLNPALISQLADIFSWEIDFHKDIQKGDTFKVFYEQRSRKGAESRVSFRILAAEIVNAGQSFFALYFEKEKGKGGYYDLNGRSLARAFLRYPLEFTSISSQFSHSRFNPVLKLDLPHNGVDFAAKRGTAVRAVSDGKVVSAGWRKGGYGRMVEIRHDDVYTTRYAHLQGFARGIRNGVKVRKGQVIGYVGSSGRSTGPHLHFELYKNQEYVDPLKFDFSPEDRIEPALRRVFENAKQLFLTELAATPQS